MARKKHRRGNKPVFGWKPTNPDIHDEVDLTVGTVTARLSNQQLEPQDLRWIPKPFVHPEPFVGFDLGPLEARVARMYGGGRRVGKTDASYRQAVELGAGQTTPVGHDWSHVPIEPLDAGLQRILARG